MYERECKTSLTIKYGNFDKLEKAIEAATSKEGKPKLGYASDKPYYARQIVEMMTKDDIGSDLAKRLQLLTSKIKEWNK